MLQRELHPKPVTHNKLFRRRKGRTEGRRRLKTEERMRHRGGDRMMWGTSVRGVMGFALLSHVLIERCHRRTMPSPGSRFM